MYVNLHIWMNQSSCGLPEYCNRSTSTPMTFSEHRPISWTRQVKVPRQANAGARGPEAPERPLRRRPPLSCLRRLCGIRWRTRLTVLRRRAIKLDKVFCRSALPLAVLARTGECHHHHHHHYYFNGACIAFLLLFCQPLSIFPLLIFRSRPGFGANFFCAFKVD